MTTINVTSNVDKKKKNTYILYLGINRHFFVFKFRKTSGIRNCLN